MEPSFPLYHQNDLVLLVNAYGNGVHKTLKANQLAGLDNMWKVITNLTFSDNTVHHIELAFQAHTLVVANLKIN